MIKEWDLQPKPHPNACWLATDPMATNQIFAWNGHSFRTLNLYLILVGLNLFPEASQVRSWSLNKNVNLIVKWPNKKDEVQGSE